MNGRKLLAGAAVLAVAGVSVSSAVRDETLTPPPIVDYGPVRLVAFDSCDNALTELRNAMAPYVSAYGLGGGPIMYAEGMAAADTNNSAGVAQKSMPEARAVTPPAQQQEHSTTNVHEQGVDEPDIVKTDGKRVFSIADGKLRVIDVASRSITGTVDPQRPERGGQVVGVDPGPVFGRPARAGLRLVDVEALSFEVHLLFHGEEGVGILIWGAEARRQRVPAGRPIRRVPSALRRASCRVPRGSPTP